MNFRTHLPFRQQRPGQDWQLHGRRHPWQAIRTPAAGCPKGILLYRSIDTYTDNHPIFREGTKRLHEKYHHYAGVIMDVFYDHFLAKNCHNTATKNSRIL
jgi:hypothetical protein